MPNDLINILRKSKATNKLLEFAQSASNAVAGNIAGPVDLINMGLGATGLPVSQSPIGGSEWMKQKGLMVDVPQGAARVLGETAGMIGPALATQFAPQIARAANQGAANLAAPATMSKQAGMISTQFGRIPENGKDTRLLADALEKAGNKAGYSVLRDGSAVSPSQYVTFSKPFGDTEKTMQVRLSNHADKYPELSTGVRTSVDPSTEVTFEQAVNWLSREGFPTDLSSKYSHIPSYAEHLAQQRALRDSPEGRLKVLQAAWLNKPRSTRGDYPTLESVIQAMRK